jgi:hypothetical protein
MPLPVPRERSTLRKIWFEHHYDGAKWSLKASLPALDGGNENLRLWGSNGHLFVISRSMLSQWNGSVVSPL